MLIVHNNYMMMKVSEFVDADTDLVSGVKRDIIGNVELVNRCL